MTVVAWDGEMMAADRQATVAGRMFSVQKVHRIDADCIAAFSGNAVIGNEVIDWLRAGADPAKYPPSTPDDWTCTLVAYRDGRLLRYEQRATPIPIRDRWHTLGSGAEFALGALECGRNAAEAVEVASKWSSECGLGVDVMRFDDP